MTLTSITEQLKAVEVPEGAEDSVKYGYAATALQESGLKGNFVPVGTVTPDAIDFDCEPYVDKIAFQTVYKDYLSDFCYSKKENSFRSLLASKGLDPYNKNYAILKEL